MDAIDHAILKTLKYRSCFEYPITASEISDFLITDELSLKVSETDLKDSLNKLLTGGQVLRHDKYFIPGSIEKSLPQLVERRKERESISRKKYRMAKRKLRFLAGFPYVKFIGVTGSVAAGNAPEGHDINLFIITASGTNRVVKNFVNLYLKFTGLHKYFPPNIFIEEDTLVWPDKNIYIAHEILLMKPLFNRQKTYERFINKNLWIFNFFGNYPLSKVSVDYRVSREEPTNPGKFVIFINGLLSRGKQEKILTKFNKSTYQEILNFYHSQR